MARSSTTETYQSSNSTSREHSKTDSRQDTTSQSTSNSRQDSTSQSSSTSQSTSKNVLDKELMNQILSGLMGTMTDEQITQFAENLLRPQLNAGLEEAQQNYETTKLSKEQEIENLAANLTRSIDEQNAAYRKSAANVETAALNRGMGRSSYTMQTLANQGDALAKAVQQLTEDSGRRSQQIQNQITQAAQQNSRTQGRLNSDYASQLAAKVQELKENQRKEWNSNYLTAISSAMGQQTTGSQQTAGSQTSIGSQQTTGSQTTLGTSETTGESSTESSGTSVSTTTSKGGGTSKKKEMANRAAANTREIYGRYSPKNTSKIR